MAEYVYVFKAGEGYLKEDTKAHILEINWFCNITIKNCTSKNLLKSEKTKGGLNVFFWK